MSTIQEEEGEVTVLTIATRSSSRSLRATIPKGIVKQLRLQEGDKLRWQIKVEGEDLIVVVKAIRKRKT